MARRVRRGKTHERVIDKRIWLVPQGGGCQENSYLRVLLEKEFRTAVEGDKEPSYWLNLDIDIHDGNDCVHFGEFDAAPRKAVTIRALTRMIDALSEVRDRLGEL